VNYQVLIDALPKAFKVYHATEDYLNDTPVHSENIRVTASPVIKLMPSIDFIVFVSHGIVESHYKRGGYSGQGVVIANGCDAEYFLEHAKNTLPSTHSQKKKIAIFQGGINSRLDFQLILDVVRRMPDWEFRFCGMATDCAEWDLVLQQANVRYFGNLSPDDFTRHMCESTVGIIPYIQVEWIRNSFPLKAYEYIACGLPVVTVPITALEQEPELIIAASTAEEYEAAIRSSADSRSAPDILLRRRELALKNSYNSRFEKMCRELLLAKQSFSSSKKRLNVAIFYDCMGSMHVNTIKEHLEAFDRYSRHKITYIPSSPTFWNRPASEIASMVDLSVFDVAIVHYSTRLSISWHLEEGLARALEGFHGLKVLFIQDEYEGTEIARSWMERLKFDIVYTCVPEAGLNYVYPAYRFPVTDFLPTLTGYVPEDPGLEQYAKPLKERKCLIAYRGRRLPAVYGELGQEKYKIGEQMKSLALGRGLSVDIEVDDSKRIYGTAWYAFLGSARATLGTESGSNIFDMDGSLRRDIAELEASNPNITFREISAKVLAPHEGHVTMNQISPKIFEAIRLRTALVLFEGSYSGAVLPDVHYIPLKKDYSNIDDVFAKIQNDAYLESMTARAYRDVVQSGRFSYETFVAGVDSDFDSRLHRGNGKRQRLLQGPIFSVERDGSIKHFLPILPEGLVTRAHPLGRPMSITDIGFLTIGFAAQAKLWFAWVIRLLIPTRAAHTLRSLFQTLSKNSKVSKMGIEFVWSNLPLPIRNFISVFLINR
jgi:hypothetical protein